MSQNKKLNWIIENSYLFGLIDVNELNCNQIEKIFMFDLDCTLIKTKSGKKFPIDSNDWELLFKQVQEKLNSLGSKYLIGIISNQKGLKTTDKINEWIDKINQISLFIRIDFVFASVKDNQYRKPMIGSYEFIKNSIRQINWDKLNAKHKIYYIGDAFGRSTDFSDTDIKFALNCKFKFKTPELFFLNLKKLQTGSVTYPIINYFEKSKQNIFFDNLTNIIGSHNKIVILMIGLPASGKSFLRKQLINKFPQFYYTNNDDLKSNTNLTNTNFVKKLSADYDFIIDDNTNLNLNDRTIKLSKFNEHYKLGIWFNYDVDLCFHLNWMRMYWFGFDLLPKVTFYTLNKKMNQEQIKNDNNFDNLIEINDVFKEFNLDDKIKYYF